MTRFDDNLWRELERRYGSELSRAEGPLSPGPRGRLPVIAGASLGVAGASAAAVIVLGAAGSPPAYAVTTHPDGTVSVVIRRIDGIAGANRRLAQLGIRARAVQVDAQCQAAVAPALRHVTIGTLQRQARAGWVGGVKGGVNARIRPTQIARDRTLVIAAVRAKGRVWLVRARAVRGAVPGCLPPVAQLVTGGAGGRTRILSCAEAPLPPRHPVQALPATNTTATNETTSTGPTSGSTTTTGPSTTPTTVTSPAPARTAPAPTTATTATTATTVTSATTGSGTTTGSPTTASSSPAGPRWVRVPPILRACLNAAQRAAPVDQGAHASSRATRSGEPARP